MIHDSRILLSTTRLVNASRSGLSIRIAQNQPSLQSPNRDTEELSKLKGVAVKSLNFTKLAFETGTFW